MFRGIPADVNTTSTDGGVYPLMSLVVGIGCRSDPSTNVYRHDAFKASSSWFLFAMSKLDCVSFKYFATGTLRDSVIDVEEVVSGTSCAVIAAAVVITASDGENITDRNSLAGIGMASPNRCGI